MKLFHGSNVEIDSVDLSKCAPYKDFGQGFYTTALEEQAWKMAHRKSKLVGGSPVITVFEVPDDLTEKKGLHCLVFDERPSVPWAVFVKNNRDRNFTDVGSPDSNIDNKYDVVVGPVANDTIGLLLRQFSRGMIDEEYLKREFDFGSLTNQYSFHSERSLAYLKKIGVQYDK